MRGSADRATLVSLVAPAYVPRSSGYRIALQTALTRIYGALVTDLVDSGLDTQFQTLATYAAKGFYQMTVGALTRAIVRAEVMACNELQCLHGVPPDWASYWRQRGILFGKLLAALETPVTVRQAALDATDSADGHDGVDGEEGPACGCYKVGRVEGAQP